MANHKIDETATHGKRVGCRLTDAEHARLVVEASLHGMTLSQLFRDRVVGTAVQSKIDVQAISELRRQGGLLKHLALSTSGTDAFDPAQLRAVLSEISACILRIHSEGTR